MKAKTSRRSRIERRTGGRIPDRPGQVPQSLTAQTLAILREKIHSGDWSRSLPSERELCDWLVVSRGTLRTALKWLEREGLVKSRQGRGWEITGGKQKSARRASTKRFVLLTPFPLNVLAPFEIFWIDNLREHLHDTGYQLEVRHEAACYTSRAGTALEELAGQIRPAGWVLHAAPAPVQQWFSDRRLPCVIVGSRHEGVALPSVDRDLPAACRHAAGMLLAKDRTRLVLLIPESGLAGDLACEKSFREAAESGLRGRTGEVLIAHHEGSPESIRRRLTAVLQRRPPLTGILVTGTKYTLGALSFLLRQGVRLPDQVALISRDNDPFLEYVVPTIARYATDPTIFARKVSRTVLRLAQGGTVPAKVYRVMPDFVPGETLG